MDARAGLRVLVIEDDRDIAEVLCLTLRQRGHSVLSASSGGEGIEAAARFMPDVVVCDIGFREGPDGLAVARSLRRIPVVECARLIAFTAFSGLDRDVREAGFEYYLQKTVDVDHLLALVETARPVELLGSPCGSATSARTTSTPGSWRLKPGGGEAEPRRPDETPAVETDPGAPRIVDSTGGGV